MPFTPLLTMLAAAATSTPSGSQEEQTRKIPVQRITEANGAFSIRMGGEAGEAHAGKSMIIGQSVRLDDTLFARHREARHAAHR